MVQSRSILLNLSISPAAAIFIANALAQLLRGVYMRRNLPLVDRLAQAGDGAICSMGFECGRHVHYSVLNGCPWCKCKIMSQLYTLSSQLAYGPSQPRC